MSLLKTFARLDNAADNKSLDASGGGVFLNLLGMAEGALIRAAASTQTLCCLAIEKRKTGSFCYLNGDNAPRRAGLKVANVI